MSLLTDVLLLYRTLLDSWYCFLCVSDILLFHVINFELLHTPFGGLVQWFSYKGSDPSKGSQDQTEGLWDDLFDYSQPFFGHKQLIKWNHVHFQRGNALLVKLLRSQTDLKSVRGHKSERSGTPSLVFACMHCILQAFHIMFFYVKS